MPNIYLYEGCADPKDVSLRPTAYFAVVTKSPSAFENNEGWTDPQNAYSSDDLYASSLTDEEKVTYKNYGFPISEMETVTKVEVGLEQYASGTWKIDFFVSWDGGNTWSAEQETTHKDADDDTVEWVDVTSATAWTPSKLSDANLRVKAKCERVGAPGKIVYLDWIPVKVNYTEAAPPPPAAGYGYSDGLICVQVAG